LTPHLVTPKDIATKRGEARFGTQLYHRENVHATVAEMSVSEHKDRKIERITADLISDKTHLAFVE